MSAANTKETFFCSSNSLSKPIIHITFMKSLWNNCGKTLVKNLNWSDL